VPFGSVETKSELEMTSELFCPKTGVGPTLRTRRTIVALVHVASDMPVNCESSIVPTIPKYEPPVPTMWRAVPPTNTEPPPPTDAKPTRSAVPEMLVPSWPGTTGFGWRTVRSVTVALLRMSRM
jgi:hypothetical protein